MSVMKGISFRTQFERVGRVHANGGNPIKTLYAAKVDQNGSVTLIEAGKENLYDYIQSHKDSCDINVIMKRFARGDVTALQQRQSFFGDFLNAPSSYAEALNSMIVAENYFESLPLDERSKYDHNFHKFLLSLDNVSPSVPVPSGAGASVLNPEGPQLTPDTPTS